jgi:hypothetical protein
MTTQIAQKERENMLLFCFLTFCLKNVIKNITKPIILTMMKFQNFEVLYGAACDINLAVAKCEDKTIRYSVEASTRKQKDLLRKQFVANFPTSWEEVQKYPDFDAEQFFGMLQKWPEVENRDKIKSLVMSMCDNGVAIPEAAGRILIAYAFNPE